MKERIPRVVYFSVSPETTTSTGSNPPTLAAPLGSYIKGLSIWVLATFLADLIVVSVLVALVYCFTLGLSRFPVSERIASILDYVRSAVLILGNLYGLAALVAAGVRHYRYFSYKFPYESKIERGAVTGASEDKSV